MVILIFKENGSTSGVMSPSFSRMTLLGLTTIPVASDDDIPSTISTICHYFPSSDLLTTNADVTLRDTDLDDIDDTERGGTEKPYCVGSHILWFHELLNSQPVFSHMDRSARWLDDILCHVPVHMLHPPTIMVAEPFFKEK